MANIVAALARLASRGDTDIVLPVHPGIAAQVYAPLASLGWVRLTEPMGYSAFVSLLARAYVAITDSGGLREEACALGVPTLVVRDETERPEVVEAGTAMVVGTQTASIVAAATRLLDDASAHSAMARASTRVGDGRAGMRIARRLKTRTLGRPETVGLIRQQ